MRGFGRWLGYLLIALALAVAAWDGAEALRAKSGYRAETLGEAWTALHRPSLDAATAAWPWLAEHAIAPALSWPAWTVLVVPGAILVLACWRRGNGRRRNRSRFS
jgi:hypothetical protein